LLERLYEDVGELATIESAPQQEGRNMHMMLAPSAQLAAKAREERSEDRKGEATDGGAPAEAPQAAPSEAPKAAPAKAPAEAPVAAEAESGDEPAAAA
jgi:translation initiation factor IF-3